MGDIRHIFVIPRNPERATLKMIGGKGLVLFSNHVEKQDVDVYYPAAVTIGSVIRCSAQISTSTRLIHRNMQLLLDRAVFRHLPHQQQCDKERACVLL
jgi:hypothetical protein